MFDTININLRSIDTQQLNFVKTVTRDLNVDTTTSRYGTTYTSHIDNLTIRTTANGLSIGNGSLCKFRCRILFFGLSVSFFCHTYSLVYLFLIAVP